ncbi:MAG: RES family NAD+ phosphorylase [Chitinophagaceae bacterium]|nr:RES family NAD+ phosphorylase [Chitinophagaceae bacterium]
MIVYNIRRAKYAKQLMASGVANRWNKDEEYVIYVGSSISLSVLEMVAHRNTIQANGNYRLLVIEVNATRKDITEIQVKDLPANRRSIHSYPALQQIGSDWYRQNKTLLLEVPSALVPSEKNYLINTRHPAFHEKVKLLRTEDFGWDQRLL